MPDAFGRTAESMETCKRRIRERLPVILFFVFSICIAGPLNLYFSNAEELWFTLPELLKIVAVVSAAVSVVLLLAWSLYPDTDRGILFKLFFGITLALYIQGNFINIRYGTGVMDGTEIRWDRYSAYAVLDTLVWLACIGLPFVIGLIAGRKKVSCYKVFACISCFLIAVQVPAVISQAVSYRPAQNKDFKITSKNLFEISDTENVLVFILDTMDERYYQAYIDTHPEYTEVLEGFVHYDNAAAAGSRTIIGLPAMFTGKPFTRTGLYSEYLHDVWTHPNAFSVLHDAGYKVSIYGSTIVFSEDMVSYTDNFESGKGTVKSDLSLAETVYKADAFMFAPHILKRFFWYSTSDFYEQKEEGRNYSMKDWTFYKTFRKQGFSTVPSEEKAMQVYHLSGAHASYKMDEYGKKAAQSTLEQQVAGGFYQIGIMLNDLKEKGLYDQSTIIITTDHGDINIGEYAMLLIKERNARGKYKTSSVPVSLFDLPNCLASLAGVQLHNRYSCEISALTDETERERHIFHNTSGISRIVINEYVCKGFAGEESSWEQVNQYDNAEAANEAYELGTTLSFAAEATGNAYTVEGFGDDTGFRTVMYGPLALLKIPVGNLPESGEIEAVIGFRNIKADYNKEIRVAANGITVYEGRLEPEYMEQGLPVSIAVDSFPQDHTLTLELRFPELDDTELGLRIDQRSYAASLEYLVLKPKKYNNME